MARFFGRNNLPITQNLVGERARYKVNAYKKDRDGLDEKPIVDFNFAERTLYGRIDQELDSVHPNGQNIVSIASTTNPESGLQLLDFCADMFQDLVNNFEKSCRLQLIDSGDPYLSKINAYRSYEDPNDDYRLYLSEVLDAYNIDFIVRGNREDEIFNIEQYTRNLIKYARELGPAIPMTYTGYMSSNQSSIFSSGIAVSIADLPFDQDADKDDFFIQNEAFGYYLNIAKNIGFSVAKNSPWLLVADLASPAIKPYLQKYGITNVASVFQTRYAHTHLSDLDKIVRGIITSYRLFVNNKPFFKQINSCGPKTTSKLIYREQVNNNSIIELNNNNNLLIELYCVLRNIEERNPLNEIDLNKLIREAKNYQKTFDKPTAISYINDRYRETRKFKDGGINSVIRKQKEKKNLTNSSNNDTTLNNLFSRRYK
jgi:hypothetical protein